MRLGNIAQSLQTPTNGVARRRDAKLYGQHMQMGSYPSQSHTSEEKTTHSLKSL